MIYKVEDYCHNQPKDFIYGMDRKSMHNKFTKRVFCFASVFALAWGLNAQNSLLFTEVCVANIDQTIDYSNNYGGWVELYNPNATSVSLDGWYISDDSEKLTKRRLSGYGILKSGCYQCIFFDHNAADGEYGPDAAKQVSVGRYPDGGSNTWKFYHPTIGTYNMATTYDCAVNIVQDSIYSPNQSAEIESVNYYTISGIRTLKPQNGIYIKVVRYKNGRQESKAYFK